MVWAFAVACAAILVLLFLLWRAIRNFRETDAELAVTDGDLTRMATRYETALTRIREMQASLDESQRRETRSAQVIRDAEAKIATLQTQGEHLEADYQRTLGQLREAESKASKVDYWKGQAEDARADLKRALDAKQADVKAEPEAKAKTPRNAKDVAAK